MLCHVTRPDSVVMEVEVDAKANGEDCLNKVGCGGIHITFCYYGSFFFFLNAVAWSDRAAVLCCCCFCAQLLIVHLPKLKATHHLCYSGKYEWGKLRQLLDDEE